MTVWSCNVPDGTYVFKFMCIYDVLVYSPEPPTTNRLGLGGKVDIFPGGSGV